MKKLQFTSHIEQQQYKSKSRLSLIVRVNVTDVSTTCAVVIFSFKVSCITSVYLIVAGKRQNLGCF